MAKQLSFLRPLSPVVGSLLLSIIGGETKSVGQVYIQGYTQFNDYEDYMSTAQGQLIYRTITPGAVAK